MKGSVDIQVSKACQKTRSGRVKAPCEVHAPLAEKAVSVCSTTVRATPPGWGGHLTREGSSQHGLHIDKRAHTQRLCHFGVVRVALTLLCASSQWTHSAWSACVTREVPACTRMALMSHFGSCTHDSSRFIKKKSSSQCPPCFLTSFHTRSLTSICWVARTPEECPHRACPKCIPRHACRKKHLTPR